MESEPERTPEPVPSQRPMSKRKKRKLMLAVIVIAAAIAVVFWGWSSTGGNFVSVSSLVNDPSHYSGKVIDVRGIVSGWNGDPSDRNFTLSDTDTGRGGSIQVFMAGPLPSGFENGKTVSIRGGLDSGTHFNATDMTVGCASKY